MPDPSLLSPTGVAMLAELPPQLRNSYDYLAVIHACAREIDLLEAAIETVRNQFDPNQSDTLLNAWETAVKLPVGGNGASTTVRRANVIARLQKLLGQAEGLEWVQTLDGILGGGWTYAEHNSADSSSPLFGIIKITVPFPSGTDEFQEAIAQVREVTSAHLEIDFASTAPFVLDQSQLDQQELGD
jgi:hypothetical protein